MSVKAALALGVLILFSPTGPVKAEVVRQSLSGAMATLPVRVRIIRCATPAERSYACQTQNFCCGLEEKAVSGLDGEAVREDNKTSLVQTADKTARIIEGENWE